MWRKINKLTLTYCDFCKIVTFDRFNIKPNLVKEMVENPPVKKWVSNFDFRWAHFHVRCLETLLGRTLEISDLMRNGVNKTFLTTDSKYNPKCEFLFDLENMLSLELPDNLNKKICLLDNGHCEGYCRYKTESINKLEGSLKTFKIEEGE